MARLINTQEGYMAQMVGQLIMEKANLLGLIDELHAKLEKERSKNESDSSGVPIGPDDGEAVAGAPQG